MEVSSRAPVAGSVLFELPFLPVPLFLLAPLKRKGRGGMPRSLVDRRVLFQLSKHPTIIQLQCILICKNKQAP